MKAQGGGNIVKHRVSIAAARRIADLVAYVAAKNGVLGLDQDPLRSNMRTHTV